MSDATARPGSLPSWNILKENLRFLRGFLTPKKEQPEGKAYPPFIPSAVGKIPSKPEPLAAPISQREQYINLIREHEPKYGIPKNLGVALATIESQFNPKAVSKKGMEGMWQLHPKYFPDVDRFDPVASTPVALQYFAENYKRFGNWDKAIAAYNMGPTRLARQGRYDHITETREHVRKVLKEWERLNK